MEDMILQAYDTYLLYSLLNTRPNIMRLTSLVPAPISYSLALCCVRKGHHLTVYFGELTPEAI
jgi:hypothetical protein